MKKTLLILAISATIASCTSKKTENAETKQLDSTAMTSQKEEKESITVPADSIDWGNVPELRDIGKFPFYRPTDDLKIIDEKNGLSEFFDYAKMENYTGSGINTTKGKLGVMVFEDNGDKKFNQQLFEDMVYPYLDKIGAKKIFNGKFPSDQALRAKLNENMWNGNKRTVGLGDDEPFAVYAFINDNKKYVLNIQSNSAQGKVFIMELK